MTLLTGRSGFVGNALKHRWRFDRELLCPTHQELDLTKYYDVEKYFDYHQIDEVVHCATASPDYCTHDAAWEKKINDDMAMVANILQFSKKSTILTSGSYYTKDEVGWSKFVIGCLCSMIPNTLELRPFGIYGPGEQEGRFPTYCFRQIAKMEPIVIKKERPISYIYIDDLCYIIEYLMKQGTRKKFYDVVEPYPTSPKEIAETCLRVAERSVPIIIEGEGEPYVGSPLSMWYDIWGWRPVKLEEGLRNLYEHLQGVQK